jgi:hypothetical protein
VALRRGWLFVPSNSESPHQTQVGRGGRPWHSPKVARWWNRLGHFDSCRRHRFRRRGVSENRGATPRVVGSARHVSVSHAKGHRSRFTCETWRPPESSPPAEPVHTARGSGAVSVCTPKGLYSVAQGQHATNVRHPGTMYTNRGLRHVSEDVLDLVGFRGCRLGNPRWRTQSVLTLGY